MKKPAARESRKKLVLQQAKLRSLATADLDAAAGAALVRSRYCDAGDKPA